MDMPALDPIRLSLLMAAGAVFALAGLWLMLRPRPEGTTAKIELFGLKFEAGSAGVLAFLIGSAFLAAPVVVPERSQVAPAADAPAVPSHGTDAQAAPDEGTAGQQALVPLVPAAVQIDSVEAEPNNTLPSANLAVLGSSIQGRVEGLGSVDWFAIDTPAEVGDRELVANLLTEGGWVRLMLTDKLGTVLDDDSASPTDASVSVILEDERHYVLVRNETDQRTNYQLTIAARDREEPRD